MEHFIGLDVSVKETSICVVDATGVVVLEIKVPSEPVAIAEVMERPIFCIKRVGLERGHCRSGSMVNWLSWNIRRSASTPVICVRRSPRRSTRATAMMPAASLR